MSAPRIRRPIPPGDDEIRAKRSSISGNCFATDVTVAMQPSPAVASRDRQTIGGPIFALGFALLLTACAICAPVAAAELSAAQVRALLASATAEAPANLRGKDLSDIDLSGTDLRHADLTGANLFGTRLVSANLRGAILAGANLNGAWLM